MISTVSTGASNPRSPKAVVLGLGVNGLALIRSLAAKGVEVIGVYTSDGEFGRYSRLCRPIRFVNVEQDEPLFLTRLINELGDLEERPVLLAESDTYVMLMSRKRDILAKYFRFLLPEDPILEKIVRKDSSAFFAADKGMQIPQTFLLSESTDVKQVVAKIPYPCILKPITHSVKLGAKNIAFDNSASLEAFLDANSQLLGQVILQTIIPGGDANTYEAVTYVTSEGVVLPVFTMRKIRQYKPDFGITSFGVSVRIPSLAEETAQFLSAINYRGLVSIEFKRHPDNGKFYFIELNSRMPHYHSLVLATGINYPYSHYLDMMGEKVDGESALPQKDGVHWINFDIDFGSYYYKRLKQQIGFFQWLFSIFRPRAFAYWKSNDQLPFWAALAHFFAQKRRFLLSVLALSARSS